MKRADKRIHIVATEQEKKALQVLSEKYAGGNLSAYLIYCGLYFDREVIKAHLLKSRRHYKEEKNQEGAF